MQHQGFLSIIVCSKNDPEVTLTYLYEKFTCKIENDISIKDIDIFGYFVV